MLRPRQLRNFAPPPGPLIPGSDLYRLFEWIAREVVREIDHGAEDPTDARHISPGDPHNLLRPRPPE